MKGYKKQKPWHQCIQESKMQVLGEIGLTYDKTKSYRFKHIANNRASTTDEAIAALKEIVSWDTVGLHETLYAIYFDGSFKYIGHSIVATGSSVGVVSDIGLLLTMALLSKARCIILAHNHPSNSLQPSKADLKYTKEVKKVFELCHLRLLDHIIFTSPEQFYSMKTNNQI